MNITVLGSGSFGTALSLVLAENGHRICMWSYHKSEAVSIMKWRENKKYLKGIPLPKNITATHVLSEALHDTNLVVIAVPTQALRKTAQELVRHLPARIDIVCAAKGLELKTGKRNSEVLKEIFARRNSILVLSGPSHAEEVARRMPCTVSLAGGNKKKAARVARIFHNKVFRVYHHTDIAGVEIGGAIKNIIAIAAGLSDGLQLGDNAKAALLARGLVEIKRFGKAVGARPSTFDGISGLGDLVTTCFSPYGRNRALGEHLSRGTSLQQAQRKIGQVVEGVPTTMAVMKRARQLKVSMPICAEVEKILKSRQKPQQAVAKLMQRSAKAEF